MAELERDGARNLRRHRKRVRQQDLFELPDHPRRPDREAESNCGERPHLRVRAHDHERELVVDECERAPRCELAVRLVDDQQRTDFDRDAEQAFDRGARLDGSGGVVGAAHEHHRRPGSPHHFGGGVRVDRVVGASHAHHDLRGGAAGDLRVQRIGGFEQQRPASGTAVREQQRLQHLVAAVRAEQTRTRLAEEGSQRVSELERTAVGIAVPVDSRERLREARHEFRRRRVRTLVGVQANRYVDLWRVVSIERAQVVAWLDPFAGRAGHDGSRRRMASACAVSPSASASVVTNGASCRSASGSSDTTWTCLRKSSTRNASAKRAVPPVGKT